MGAFRSKHVTQGDDPSFIGGGGGFQFPRTEDGSRFTRCTLAVFEYRFHG